MSQSPITARPGQIIGWRPARRHERAGMYPIFAIAGGSAPAGGEGGGSGEGQNGGQSAGQNGDVAGGQNGSQASGSGQQAAGDAGQQSGQNGDAQKVEDLPDWAQKQIRDLRKEAGDNRTGRTTAEQKHTETLDAIAKALGLKKDETPDPVKLAEQLTAAQTAVKDTAVELAVYRTAGKNGGDPDALLDSRSFMTRVRDLDHTGKDFAAKLADEIKAAVKDNPKLKTGQAPGSSSVDHAGGPGERRSDKPKSLADAVSASYGA